MRGSRVAGLAVSTVPMRTGCPGPQTLYSRQSVAPRRGVRPVRRQPQRNRAPDMKALQDKPHLRLQFPLAGCDRLRFALQLEQAYVAVGRGDGVQVGVLVPNNIDRSWHVPLLYLLSIPSPLMASRMLLSTNAALLPSCWYS